MKMPIHSQTSTAAPLKFGTGTVFASQTLQGMSLLRIHATVIGNPFSKRVLWYLDLSRKQGGTVGRSRWCNQYKKSTNVKKKVIKITRSNNILHFLHLHVVINSTPPEFWITDKFVITSVITLIIVMTDKFVITSPKYPDRGAGSTTV